MRKLNKILVIVLLTFIWGQSMIPAKVSTAESEYVLGFVEQFVAVDTAYMQDGRMYDFLMTQAGNVNNDAVRTFLYRCINFFQMYYFSQSPVFWIRKLAHFTEYMLLGFLLCTLLSRSEGRGRFLLPWLLCAGASSIDEAIQRITPGRFGLLRDVVLDMMGATTGVLLGIAFLALIARRACRQGRQQEAGKTS